MSEKANRIENESSSGMTGRWLFAGLVILALSFSCFQLSSPDLCLHLAVGKVIATEGRIPAVNEFLYTNQNYRPLPNDKWLFRLVCFVFYRAGGTAALVGFRMLLVSATVLALVWAAKPSTEPLLVTVVAALWLALLSTRMLLRPDLWSLLLAATTIGILQRWSYHPRRICSSLAGLQVLWVNSHGFFFFGPILVGFWWLDALVARLKGTGRDGAKREKSLRVALAATFAACFLNPYGWRGVAYPWSVMTYLRGQGGVFRASITELAPTFTFIRGLDFPQSLPYLCGIFLMGLTLFVFIMTFEKRKIREWLLLVFSLMLSLQFIRNVGLCGLACVPLGACALSDLWPKLSQRYSFAKRVDGTGGKVFALTLLLAVSFLAVTGRYARALWIPYKTTGLGWSEDILPVELSRFFGKEGLEGPIYNDFSIGSCLAWFLYPGEKAFINGDSSAYPVKFFEEAEVLHPTRQAGYLPPFEQRFRQWDREYHFRSAVVSIRSETGMTVMQMLRRDPGWAVVYVDSSGVCFARREGKWSRQIDTLQAMARRSMTRLIQSPVPGDSFWRVAVPSREVDLAGACRILGWHDLAAGLARRALQIGPGSPLRKELETYLKEKP